MHVYSWFLTVDFLFICQHNLHKMLNNQLSHSSTLNSMCSPSLACVLHFEPRSFLMTTVAPHITSGHTYVFLHYPSDTVKFIPIDMPCYCRCTNWVPSAQSSLHNTSSWSHDDLIWVIVRSPWAHDDILCRLGVNIFTNSFFLDYLCWSNANQNENPENRKHLLYKHCYGWKNPCHIWSSSQLRFYL